MDARVVPMEFILTEVHSYKLLYKEEVHQSFPSTWSIINCDGLLLMSLQVYHAFEGIKKWVQKYVPETKNNVTHKVDNNNRKIVTFQYRYETRIRKEVGVENWNYSFLW